MGKRSESNARKESFLRKVLELKGQLFGAFSPTVTKDTKRQAWTELRDYAVAIGLITADKDFTYVRDATWPNMRNRTVTKVDNASQTGSGGGSNKKLDDIDHLVLHIIGKESPVFQGFGVRDSLGEIYVPTVDTTVVRTSTSETLVDLEHGTPTVPTVQADGSSQNGKLQQQEAPKSKCAVKRRVIVQHPDATKEIEALKKRKLQLEVRKLELEVWEKEKSLNIKHSTLTSDIEELREEEQHNENVQNVCISNNDCFIVNDQGSIVMVHPQTSQ